MDLVRNTTAKTNFTWKSLMMEMEIGPLSKMGQSNQTITMLVNRLLPVILACWKDITKNEELWSSHHNGLDMYLSLNVEQRTGIWKTLNLQLEILKFMVNLNRDLNQENAENFYYILNILQFLIILKQKFKFFFNYYFFFKI